MKKSDIKKGDILSYESDNGDKWIIIFHSWYEPYEGHMHYYALYVCDKEFIVKSTCFLDEDFLEMATEEEKKILFDEMKRQGYEWDGSKINKI